MPGLSMGVDAPAAKFLCGAKQMGVDFTTTATIGRQSFFPDPATLRRVFAVLGVSSNAQEFLRANPYAEAFLSLLGAKQTTAVDASDYEGATHTHDMNLPIPGHLREQFSTVFDGGTLEHVFNVPQGLKNCMEMLRVGGHFIQANVANNFMGHGFWQFSPELIYRVFSPANGYRVETVLLHEFMPQGAWYRVNDPAQVRRRVELCNRRRTYIFTVARRVAVTEIFARPPQQSDYAGIWGGDWGEARKPRDFAGLRRFIPPRMELAAKDVLRGVIRSIEFDPACYRRIDEKAVLAGKLA
jgi:hypothetical protein